MTSWATDDLAQVLIAPEREFAGFAQGVLREWDADRFANVVEVRGGTLTNLPVAAGVEALTYQAGDVLMLTRWKLRSGRGAATYWIGMGGRVIVPGTGAAEVAIAWMRGSLGKETSAAVFADRIHSADVSALEGTGSATYTDLATEGPTVSNVEIVSGRALVFVSGRIRAQQSGNGDSETFMSFQVSGATSRSPDDSRAASTWVRLSNHNGSLPHVTDIAMRGAAQILLAGLNEGQHTFQAKYRTTGADSGFAHRTLTVIAF